MLFYTALFYNFGGLQMTNVDRNMSPWTQLRVIRISFVGGIQSFTVLCTTNGYLG